MRYLILLPFLFSVSAVSAAKSEESTQSKITCEVQLKSVKLMMNRTSFGSSPRLECAKSEVIDIHGKNICTEELDEIFKGDGKVHYRVKNWEECFEGASQIAQNLIYKYSYPTDMSPAHRYPFVLWKYRNKNSKKLRGEEPSNAKGKLNKLSALHHDEPEQGDLRYENKGSLFIQPLF